MKQPNKDSYDKLSKILASELPEALNDLTPEMLEMPENWDNPLPKLPRDILDWIEDARPMVDGLHRHIEWLT